MTTSARTFRSASSKPFDLGVEDVANAVSVLCFSFFTTGLANQWLQDGRVPLNAEDLALVAESSGNESLSKQEPLQTIFALFALGIAAC